MLNKEQFRILRQKGTEAPGSGEYNKFYPEEGVFACAACSTPLYKVGTKFDSGCGCVMFLFQSFLDGTGASIRDVFLTTGSLLVVSWPAFYDAIPGAITRHEDRSLFSTRTEIVCTACGGCVTPLYSTLRSARTDVAFAAG